MTLQQPSLRRNITALTADFVSFSIGFAFFDPVIIVPAFTKVLTGSEFAIGLLAALRIIFITVPQVWAASVLTASPRKKPLLFWSSVGGRLPVVLLAVMALLFAEQSPWLVMGVLTFGVILFFTSEGLNSVSWPDIVGKLLPATIRGRFLGMGQLLSSLGALGAGYLLRRILATEGLAFPLNWAVIFGCASLGLFGSVIAIGLLREHSEAVSRKTITVRTSIALLAGYLRTDVRLRRIVRVQILMGIASSVFPFFVIRAQDLIPQGPSTLGTFIMVQNAGGMLAAMVCGYLVDRVGSWSAVRLEALVESLTLALVTLAPLLGAPLIVYMLAFGLLGFVSGSSWWTFTAYLMDIASEEQRPSYLAASGILNSPVFVASLLVGAAYGRLKPESVFAVALGCALAALASSLVLVHMRAGVPIER